MSLPPKVGTPIVKNVWLYWSLKYSECNLVTYSLSTSEYVPLALEVPVEIIVTEDAMAGVMLSLGEARKKAHEQFIERIAELDRLQAQYLAIEMSPTEAPDARS